MDSDKLIAIAIAAAIGALVKELFTAGIKHSAITAKKLLKAAPSFITRHWKKIDFLLTLFGLLYFLFIFFILDKLRGSVEVTHSDVRIYVFLGIIIVGQFFTLLMAGSRLRTKEAEQGGGSDADEAV